MGYHLGVDVGTTFTAAALSRQGRAEPVTLGTRSVAVPSVAYLRDDGELLFGQSAARRAATEPSRVAREFKRRVGDPTPLVLGGTPIVAEMLMARFLAWVVERVTASEGEPPTSLAVTHPANWGVYKLDLFRQAIRQVGVEVDNFVPEPVAAASFYASQRDLPSGAVVAVYDLGGGTFDAAVVRSEQSGFTIVGQADGVERLGGIDFDHAVLRYVASAVDVDVDALDPDDTSLATALGQLREACVDAKEALSSETGVSVPVMLPGLHSEVRLTRGELESMIRPVLDETLVALRRTIVSAGLAEQDVTSVLLVGGSSRIPLVDQLVVGELDRPTAVDARPKDAIPMGAAIIADHAASQQAGPPQLPPSVAAAPLGPPGPPPMPGAPPGGPWPAPPLAEQPTGSRSKAAWWAAAAVALVGVGALATILITDDDNSDPDEMTAVNSGADTTTTTEDSTTTTGSTPSSTAPTTSTTSSTTSTTGAPTTTPPDEGGGSGATAGKTLTVDGSAERWSGSCFYEEHGTGRPVMAEPGKCIDVGPDYYVRVALDGSTETAVCWKQDVSIQDNQLNASDVWLQVDGGWMSVLYFTDWTSAQAGLPAC